MKKIGLAVCLLVIGVVVFRIAESQLTPPPVKSHRLFPIVRLLMNGRTYCSGTVVTPTIIITAAHCVMTPTLFGPMMNTDPIEIRASDNVARGHSGRAIGASTQLDQGLIKGDFSAFEPRAFISDPQQLTAIKDKKLTFVSCGYPMGGKLYCSLTSFKAPIDFAWAVYGVLIPGMSGGPTMLIDGTVVAVNVAVEADFSIVSPLYNIDLNFQNRDSNE